MNRISRPASPDVGLSQWQLMDRSASCARSLRGKIRAKSVIAVIDWPEDLSKRELALALDPLDSPRIASICWSHTDLRKRQIVVPNTRMWLIGDCRGRLSGELY
jgi:hypothetical protein